MQNRAACAVVSIALTLGYQAALCQTPGSLSRVTVPKPSNLEKYVRDQNMLVALGKALFWDMQVASDDRVACATCHFHAGADHRAQNQLSNPLAAFRPNYTLTAEDFPFHMLADANNRNSAVLRDSGQRAGSAGIFRRSFSDIAVSSTSDHGSDLADAPTFSIAGLNVRQVTVRNAPSVINAVFNFRNFWDGRASNIFTGQTPFGESDPRPNALVWNDGRLVAESLRIDNSSLASQAVGPPVNAVEMSYDGRTWPKLGRRMLALRPLALQRVAADDSVLGALANSQGRGLAPQYTYLGLIQAAFQPEYWSAPPQAASEFTHAEFNFAMFFGLAVQAYETTLVSDDTRFDRFSQGDGDALTSEERAGLQLFRTRGNCDNCHGGAEFTLASVSSVNRRTAIQRAGRNGPIADTGFFRTGVRPVADDIGLGGKDDFGNPLSISAVQNPGGRLNVDGAFKTPQLRNVEFTGPFFHNGGQATLEQVVEFYSRGADFGGNLGNGIRRLNLNATDRAALVAFMKALSDDRVRFERAPFDHPELCVPIGHVEVLPSILQPQLSDPRFRLSAADKWAGIPVVGRQGNAVPLQTFDELLQGIGTDGSRAHTLTDACTVP